jgi:hypothetical protein
MKTRVIAIIAVTMCFAAGCANMKPIGDAKMDKDGVIHAWLRAELPDGEGHGDSFMKIEPKDESYQEWLKHLGGLKPGECKLVPPWPD